MPFTSQGSLLGNILLITQDIKKSKYIVSLALSVKPSQNAWKI